jgi:hypothetical protein
MRIHLTTIGWIQFYYVWHADCSAVCHVSANHEVGPE